MWGQGTRHEFLAGPHVSPRHTRAAELGPPGLEGINASPAQRGPRRENEAHAVKSEATCACAAHSHVLLRFFFGKRNDGAHTVHGDRGTGGGVVLAPTRTEHAMRMESSGDALY